MVKTSWKDKVDPAFDEFIKIYKDLLSRCHLPSNTGYLGFEEETIRFLEHKGFPALIDYNKPAKKNKRLLYDLMELGVNSDIQYILKISGRNLNRNVLKMINGLPSESRNFYLSKLNPDLSEEQVKSFLAGNSPEELLELRKDLTQTLKSLFFRVMFDGYWELKKYNSNKHHKIDRLELIKISLSMIYDSIALLAFKKTLKELMEEAKKGDDEALIKAVQINKTLFDLDWVRKRIRKAMFFGDIRFFDNFGEAIKKTPLENDLEYGELILVLKVFWDYGLCRLANKELIDVLEAGGVRIHDDPESFRRFVNRLKDEEFLTA